MSLRKYQTISRQWAARRNKRVSTWPPVWSWSMLYVSTPCPHYILHLFQSLVNVESQPNIPWTMRVNDKGSRCCVRLFGTWRDYGLLIRECMERASWHAGNIPQSPNFKKIAGTSGSDAGWSRGFGGSKRMLLTKRTFFFFLQKKMFCLLFVDFWTKKFFWKFLIKNDLDLDKE